MLSKILLLVAAMGMGQTAMAQTAPFPSGPEFSCRDKDGKTMFSLHLESSVPKPSSATQTIVAKIQGTVTVDKASVDLAKVFIELEVEVSDVTLIVQQPLKAIVAGDPYDLEITIDRSNGLGRFSVVSNRPQQPASIDRDDSIEVDCSDRSH